MVDITSKITSLRRAIASARVELSRAETVQAVRDNCVPKGNVLESARVAALFAVKKTSDVIPDCHPIPIESTAVSFELSDHAIEIRVDVQCVYRTGVEVEAMHGASVAALTVYDMLKPIDPEIVIRDIRLQSKSGGKSAESLSQSSLNARIVVCSDSVSAGQAEDASGPTLHQYLESQKFSLDPVLVIADEADQIKSQVLSAVDDAVNLLVVCGGTGLSPRDQTPDTVEALFERNVPGIAEAMRSYGQERTQRAMLSRSCAGLRGQTLILCIPGSPRGAIECMRAVFPAIKHAFAMIDGEGHPAPKATS